MIVFDTHEGRFNYRVAGVCIHEEHVLLQQAAADDFWALPGGRPEFGEHSRAALEREMREEIGEGVGVGPLFWVLENFLTYDDRVFHEVAFHYEMTLPPASSLLDLEREYAGIEPATSLVFRWFPVNRLSQIRLYPTVLREALRDVPAATQHLIHRDEPA